MHILTFLETFADYFTKINDPIDLNTISNRIDSNYYTKFADFMEDITLMTTNAKSYFTQNQKQIINKVIFFFEWKIMTTSEYEIQYKNIV